MTWTRNKTIPQIRHCEKCGKQFSTTISDKIVCSDCEHIKRFCVKCGKELNSWTPINEKWCSDKCKEKLGKEFVIKKVNICNGCHKEIAGKSTIYNFQNYGYSGKPVNECWHVKCKYDDIKKEIGSTENTIKYEYEDIENTKKDIKNNEKKLEKQKKEMEELAIKYPVEIVSQLL